MEIPAEGGNYEVGVTSSSSNWTASSTSDWVSSLDKTATGLAFTVEKNSGIYQRQSYILFNLDGKEYKLLLTQSLDPALTKGAGSERAKELVSKIPFITQVTADSFTQVDEYVSMLTMQFKGQDAGTNFPVAIYLYEIDLTGDVTLAVSCADDSDASIKSTSAQKTETQTIRNQLATMQANRTSIKVLGGVNGDFYDNDANNLLQGVCYRNGICLKDSFHDKSNTVFAIRNDGTAIILDQTSYPSLKSSIKEAVGGRAKLISSGSLKNDSIDSSTNELTYEPRTAVGISQDRKTVYLLVIDGRHDTWSYGATYHEIAQILLAAGAYNAINLDGGGSNTFVQRVSDDGTSSSHYKRLNYPRSTEDGSVKERAVVNGIAIVKNK